MQGQRNHLISYLEERGIPSVEEVEIVPAGARPKKPPDLSSGGERHRKRKCSTVFLEWTRNSHCQSDEDWNCFNGNISKMYERWGGAHMGFSQCIDTILN